MSITTLILDGIWGRPWRLRWMKRIIEEACGPAEIYRYDCSGAVPFEELGAKLAKAIRRHDGPVNLVGHSMGGLVIRSAHLMDPTLPIRRAAFLNSPHGGSWLAYALPLPAVRQMRPGSEFLKRLDAAEWNIPTLVAWCLGDLMILPNRSARWHRADETICCCVPAHIWPVYSRKLHRRIAKFLAGATEAVENDEVRLRRAQSSRMTNAESTSRSPTAAAERP